MDGGKRMTARIGVIGCGDWGRNHIRTAAGLGVLAAVGDADPARRAAVAAQFGVPDMAPAAMLAEPAIDGVILALPPHRHADMALAVLRAGKHLLVEKPMSLDMAGAEAIVAAARAAGVVAMTGHLLRFHPAFEAMETLVRSGGLGRIRYVHTTRIGLGKFFQQTDALWDIAPHDLSLLLAITGEIPCRVHMEGAAMLTDAPDFAHLHLTFPSGIRSHSFISRLSPKRDRRFTVIGEGGMAVYDDLEPWDRKLAIYRHRILNEAGAIRIEGVEPDYVPLTEVMPLAAEQQHFIDCIASGAAPRASVAEGLDVLR
ncbi:MAG: Gfo/Idh/MocA family protein, partial [Gemmobacter sp.]